MPGAVRVILEPIPTEEGSFSAVAQARVSLVNRGPGTTLATTSRRPAELSFSLATITSIRSGTPAEAKPLATLRGVIQLDEAGLTPTFDLVGNDIVSLLAPSSGASGPPPPGLALQLDPTSFGEARSLVIPLPPPDPESNKLELRVDLKIGGAPESGAALNDVLDFFTPKVVQVQLVKLISITFTTDHQVLLDNDADLTARGNPIGQPEWKIFARARPILHTKNQNVRIQIEVEVHPPNATPFDSTIEGKGTFKFESPKGTVKDLELSFKRNVSLGGGTPKFQIVMDSAAPLPDVLTKLSGDLFWTADLPGKGPRSIGKSEGHVIYTTLGKSIDPPDREQGVTRKRVEMAQDLVNETGATESLGIVKSLMANKFPFYAIDSDPSVGASFNHPTYFNDIGGAWHVLPHLQASAECQAIVRIVRAIGNVLGMAGEYDFVLASVDVDTVLAFEEDGATGKGTEGQSRLVNGRDSFPFLVAEDPGTIGRVFEISGKGSPLLNHFEACLRFKSGENTVFYPGGVGGKAFRDVAAVIRNSFVALIFVSDVAPLKPGGPARARLESIKARFAPQPGDEI